jgi:hypothetical protein
MLRQHMMSWLLFPPQTKEVQLDEKWSFVGKKEKTLDSDQTPSTNLGDFWDHTAIDAESRLLLVVVHGKRTAENCKRVVEEVKARTGGRKDILITSDEHAPYETALKAVYGETTFQTRKPGPGRPPHPKKVVPNELCYATVKKTRKDGRVVQVIRTLVFGTMLLLLTCLANSSASKTINTAFVERNNGTDRCQNSRKGRKTLGFSKDAEVHMAVSFFVAYGYNFMWPVRTLNLRSPEGRIIHRTPAMAAGLTNHIWTLREWCTFPALLKS